MTVGLSSTAGLAHLTSWSGTYTYVKLHVGDPGAAGTSNAATETTRKSTTWASPSAATGTVSMANTNALSWTSVAGTEDYTHVSYWTLSSGGVFGGSGLVTADAVTAGNNFSIPISSLTVSQPVAA
jgi:hypothetical protein